MNVTLSLNDALTLSPLLILLCGSLVILLIEAFGKGSILKISLPIAILTIVSALFAAWNLPEVTGPLLTPWITFTPIARFFTILFLLTALASTLLSYSFFKQFKATYGEFLFLLLAASFGLLLIASAADFLTLFLGLETLSIPLYILCGYMKRWEISSESSIKYFLMGALGAAFLLYGIALIYGATGTTRFDALLGGYNALAGSGKTLFLSGIAFVTLGLAFKAAIVPFHVWAPDVYDGAPTPITAFMAVGTKAGAFAAFAIIFLKALPKFDPVWSECIALLAFPTLIYANIVALRQIQLRRFFAYSGISHAGFLLIPLAAGGPEAIKALSFYLVIYATATLGAFSVLSFLDNKMDGVVLKDLTGLFKRSPFLASIFALCMLTLAGIPPTAGFFAKFYIFKVAFEAGYYALVIVGLLTTILSAYYYLRFVAVMFQEPTEAKEPLIQSWPSALVGVAASGCIVLFSILPGILSN